MTREDFIDRFRPILMGLLVDAYTCSEQGAAKFKRIEKDGRTVQGTLKEMFDSLKPPKATPQPVASEPKAEWTTFLSFEPPMLKVNERMAAYAKLPDQTKADLRTLIFDHATKRGWDWNKDTSSFEVKKNGKQPA